MTGVENSCIYARTMGISAGELGGADLTDGLGPMARWERDREVSVPVIVQRVAEGETLRWICRSRGWPYSVVAQWVAEDEAVASAYEQASRIWADEIARETVAIADGEGAEARDSLRVKARQWVSSKLDRKRYGEVQDVKHSGSIGLSLMSVLATLPRASAEREEKDVTPVAPAAVTHELI